VTRRPLSAAEHQLWLAEHLRVQQVGTLDATYSTAEVLAIDSGIDLAVLAAALRELPGRHEALRTSFIRTDGKPYAVVDAATPIVIDRWAVAGEEEFDQLLAESVRRPFPLDQPPLWRAILGTSGPVTYLALVLHHIVADGWSVDLLVHDLGQVYLALAEGKPLPDPPLYTYGQYADHHAERLASGELDSAAEHWRRTLAGAPSTSTVPGLGPSTERGGAQYFQPLPPGRHDQVRQLAARLRATPYAVYLASYALALARLTGSRDVVIGVPSANRRDDAVLDVVGPFAAILPVRIRLTGTVRPEALARQLRTTVFEAIEHEELPLARINAGHGSARTDRPLFQTVAMERGWRDPETSFADLPARRLWTSTRTAKYDLVVTFPTSTQDERIVVEYDRARYDQLLAASIAREVGNALDDILGAAEITVLPEQAESGAQPVHERVTRNARRTPDHPAVVAGRDWLSYAELDHRADLVATGLRRHGVRPGDLVGLRLPRGIDFVIAVLAVAKSGAAYVPTDPAWPESHLRQVLAHTTMTVNDVSALIADEPLAPTAVHWDDPLCVLYTSGSTGGPKGVLIAHRSVCRLAAPDQPFALRRTDRLAHQANLAFDATTFEIWGTLLAGGTLTAGLPNDPGPADYVAELRGCTAAFLSTGLFTELVRHPDCRAALRSLRMLAVGGSVLGPGPATSIEHPEAVQLNAYGPTEGTTFATAGPMAARGESHTVPIGSPISGTRAYVLDQRLNPVRDGEIGELHLAGDGIAYGYLSDPRQTAQRFTPDPFLPGERMYATGDRVRRLPNGDLDFIGRNDVQIKYRGFRVEPAEIETALLDQPGVEAAFVGLNATGQLVAAVRADSADPRDLRERLGVALPAFMVPVHIAVVDRIPLTPRGKADVRRLLSAVGGDRSIAPVVEHSRTTPGRGMEELWSSVLGVAVAADANFFDSGGDSLKVLRLLAECRAEFGIDLRPSDLFDHPTPRDFTALLTDRMRRSDD
jgi:amino acid adenylation domain-containing protein